MTRRRHLALGLACFASTVGSPWLLGGCSRRESVPEVGYTLLDGRREQLSARRGQVTLVHFWATTCAVCRQEMPSIVGLQTHFAGQPFNILAVAMRYDPPAFVADYAEAQRLPFDIAIDNTGDIARAFGDVELTPTACLLDRAGRIVQRQVGLPDFAALQRTITGLLIES